MYKTSFWRTEPARVLFTTIALPQAKHPLGSFACSHAEAALAVPTPPGSPCPAGCRIVVAGLLVVTGLRPALAPGRWPHHDGLHNPRRLFRRRHSLRLPAEAPNGSRLPCRAGTGIAPRPVWTFAQNTAPTLAGLLLEPHSQSEGLAAHEAARREPPAIPSDLPRLVTRIQLVVRSLDSLRVKASMLPRGERGWGYLAAALAAGSVSARRVADRFQPVERGSTSLPQPALSRFGSFVLAGAAAPA